MTDQAVTPATTGQVAAARNASDALGLYFQLADPASDPDGWRPAELLYEPGAGPLGELLDRVAARLGGCERRVAASLFYQGYAARLVSPQLGCLAAGGCLPALPADQVLWREPATEMIQLALPAGPGWQGPAEPLLDQLLVQSFTAHLDPLAVAIRSKIAISADLLQDNAASALISGLRLLDARLAARTSPPPAAGPGSPIDPELANRWRSLATRALVDPRLHDSGTLAAGEPGFIRRSCCLYYRTPGGGFCGDCPLA